MRTSLEEVEKLALIWMGAQTHPVYASKPDDPRLSTIRQLVSKRLAKVAKIMPLPGNEHVKVSCFVLTRKGKRYYSKVVAGRNL